MSKPAATILWDAPKLKRLKAAYAEAFKTKTGNDTFMFDNHEFVLGYAKYLIEYLESQLQPAR